MSFADKLISWYRENGRDLPWRQTKDPYTIWLSEIILQQTRVEQGKPYFYRFHSVFSTVAEFAAASEDEILRLWQGLGYYSRARNMHCAAKMVVSEFKGVFPTDYDELRSLPGIGDYTASAISSFSSNQVHPVVDGNVYRVLSRIFGIDTPINSTKGATQFKALANELIDEKQPGLFNHAIMDFGAIHCKPKQPLCTSCIFSMECYARINNLVADLPVKLKKSKIRERFFHYFIIQDGDHIMVSKRGQNDVWANLYEFPMLETETPIEAQEFSNTEGYQKYFGSLRPQPIGLLTKHILTHQRIFAQFYLLPSSAVLKEKKAEWEYIFSKKIDSLAKHKLIFSFLEKNRELFIDLK